MAVKAPYNWAALTRYDLYSYFRQIKKEVCGQTMTRHQLHQTISQHIKEAIPVKVNKIIDPKISKGYVYTGGYYYSWLDQQNKTPITIEYSYHPDDLKLKITPYRVDRLAVRFADVVLHEVIHMRQFRARNFKLIPGYQSEAASASQRKDQEYLGDRDEMGALSFNIACEMLDICGPNSGTILAYLESNQALRAKNSWWCAYLKAFNCDHNHPIIKRMTAKVMRQLPNAWAGKPFKTTNHLTY